MSFHDEPFVFSLTYMFLLLYTKKITRFVPNINANKTSLGILQPLLKLKTKHVHNYKKSV